MVNPPAEASELELGVVQETLLIPLYLRACETRRADAVCRDEHAVRIVDQLRYDFRKFAAWNIQMDVAVRTEVFDEQTRKFLGRHPHGAIINLGAGLDARGYRLDNGTMLWVDLDMPDAIALRRRFYHEDDRHRDIAKSMFDETWCDDVESWIGDRPLLCLAEGLFMYFHESDVRQLLAMVADRWPGAEILFQTISPSFVQQQQNVAAVNQTKAQFHFGIHSGHEVAAWRDDYEFLDEWALIDRHRKRWRHLRWTTFLFPWEYRRIREVMKITHLRLGKPA